MPLKQRQSTSPISVGASNYARKAGIVTATMSSMQGISSGMPADRLKSFTSQPGMAANKYSGLTG